MKRATAAEKRAYAAVEARAEGLCEGCGRAQAIQMHHRQYRSRGAPTTVTNLLHVCLKCHRVAESPEGHEMGWSCHSWDDPAEVPVLYRGLITHLTE